MSGDAYESKGVSGKKTFIIAIVIAALSIFGSTLMFGVAKLGFTWGTTNKGDFVTPPVTLGQVGWIDATGRLLDGQGKWWLWLNDPSCRSDCDEIIGRLIATHTLLNRQSDRARLAILLSEEASPRSLPLEVTVLSGVQKTMPEGIYIIDPIGNFVFRYGADGNPKDILSDLKRLLKMSQIG